MDAQPPLPPEIWEQMPPVAHMEQATAQALAEPVAEAWTSVQAQPAAYLDETGWREGQPRAWLWTAATAGVTVFVVQLSRRAKVAQELLGERFWGDLVTDRWSAYTWYPAWRRQVCWAHLLRDIAAMIERGGSSQAIGEALQAQARQMCHWWHRVRDGTLDPTTFASYMGPVRQEVERWLEAGYKARRWVVERTHSWRHRFRRVLIRWDKNVHNYLGFLHLACAYITYRQSGLLG